MPQNTTEIIPGYYYHIYNRSVESSLLFRDEKNYSYFISKIRKYLLPVSDILVYCLMPNHYHLLVKIRDENFPRSMQKLALSYVVAFNKHYQRKGHLFQGHYQKKHIQHIDYLLCLSRYIHVNPVKAGLSKTPQDWEYSSYAEFVGIKRLDFINPSYILDILSDDLTSTLKEQQQAYQEYIQEWIDFRQRDEVLLKDFVPK